VEKGAYITGDGDRDHWKRAGGKGARDLRFSRKACLVLRGLPFTATECDLADFLEQCGVLGSLAPGRPIVLLVNPQGRLSGFAEVNMVGEAEADEARASIHMQRMGNRYIEVLPAAPAKGNGSGWSGSACGEVSPSGSSSARRSRGSRNNEYDGSSSRRGRASGGYGFSRNAMYDQGSWSGSWRRDM
jgi:RNA recognition motif-containing protein